VASAYALPFADGAFAAVLNVFSPRDFTEMNRMLAPGGAALVVTPGPTHLTEIKQLLYDDPRQHSDEAGDVQPAERESAISFEVGLTDEAMRVNVLHMTPYGWAATAARRHAIATRLRTVTVDMRLRLHRRPT